VLLVLAAGWAEGRRRAPGERSELVACAARADETTAAAERRLATTVTYLAPALGSHDDELHRSMLGLVSRTAGDVVGPVEEALARCREVGLWPFNRSHAAARDALVAWLTAERDRLRAVVRDGSAFDEGYAEVRRLADRAAAALEE
jgi:hypothetical protein